MNSTKHSKFHSKNRGEESQLQYLFNFLQGRVTTAQDAAEKTGIPLKNLCRYKRILEQSGKLWVLYFKPCPVTGHLAGYITTDPKKVPQDYTPPAPPKGYNCKQEAFTQSGLFKLPFFES